MCVFKCFHCVFVWLCMCWDRNLLEYLPDWVCDCRKIEVMDIAHNLLSELPSRLLLLFECFVFVSNHRDFSSVTLWLSAVSLHLKPTYLVSLINYYINVINNAVCFNKLVSFQYTVMSGFVHSTLCTVGGYPLFHLVSLMICDVFSGLC